MDFRVMKTLPLSLLAGFACYGSAFAGGSAAPWGSQAVEGGPLWNWFAGVSTGVLSGSTRGYSAVQAGFRSGSGGTADSVYLEIGRTSDRKGYFYDSAAGSLVPVSGNRVEIAEIKQVTMPLLLQFRHEQRLAGRWSCEAGFGGGLARMESTYNWSWSQVTAPPAPFHGEGRDARDGWRLMADVFAGISCSVTPTSRVSAGVRYFLMNDVNRAVAVTGASSYRAGLDRDLLWELGYRAGF